MCVIDKIKITLLVIVAIIINILVLPFLIVTVLSGIITMSGFKLIDSLIIQVLRIKMRYVK